MRVLVIGCGKTGSAIAKQLAANKLADELLLYSRSGRTASELAKKVSSANPKITARKVDSIEAVQKPDFVIVALSGMPQSDRKKSFFRMNDTHAIRESEYGHNKSGVFGIVSALKSLRNSTGIIVVTNPMDVFANFLGKELSGKKVIGFGVELDRIRYSKLIGKDIMCVGLHGKAVPIIGKKTLFDYSSVHKTIERNLLEYLRAKGMTSKITGRVFGGFFKKVQVWETG